MNASKKITPIKRQPFKSLNPVAKEVRRRESKLQANERRIARIREEADEEIKKLEDQNTVTRQILSALKAERV